MKINDKLIFFLIALFLGYLVYCAKSVLAPFAFSLIAAYFLNPVVNFLNRKCKMSRLGATSLIMVLFIFVMLMLMFLLLPMLVNQLLELVMLLPSYFQTLVGEYSPRIISWSQSFGFEANERIGALLSDHNISAKVVEITTSVASNAVNSSLFVINLLSLFFIMPILLFYLLKDWELLVRKIDFYLPRDVEPMAKRVALEIDQNLSAYIRGQVNVCLILAFIYSVSLSLSGLNFGFLIGLMTGLLIFIPYIGMLCGVITATIVGLIQWGFDPLHICVITAIFIFGQIVESNFLTPKLIGDKIGLHPVWIVFGLFFFGALLGFVGVIFAMPLTAISAVLVRNFLLEYKKRFA